MTIDINFTTINRMLSPLVRKIEQVISRGVVARVNDTLKMQNVQVELRADETQDDVEHFQEYGFTSHPQAGAEVLFASVEGRRAGGVVACVTDRRYRPKTLTEGEVALYTLQNGIRVLCKSDGTVAVGTNATDFVVLTTLLLAKFNAHTHPTGTGPSGPPTQPLVAADIAATEVKAK
jgi:phage gp45-like